MINFVESMSANYMSVTKMTLFNYLKTDNPVYNAIMSTMIISLFGCVINYIYDNRISEKLFKITIDDFKYFFYRKNTVVIEGKKSSIVCTYNASNTISSVYSNRFKAIWNYIIENIDNNDTIFRIKESHTNFQSSGNTDRRQNSDIFMVFQNKHFKIDDNIFVKSEIEEEETGDDKESKVKTKTDKITINVYSYIHSVSYLKKYIDKITEKHLASIKENRNNKRFIYFLEKTRVSGDESSIDCWREDLFESTRSFNNIFFDGKTELLSKINYFINNRDWYFNKGIPYSLGIGLYGPPGTGKTSFIKALANYTGRHVIIMSLKIIKTKRQLEQFFFENTYNDKNEKQSISFDKKIIVFEDIDCIGDIILDRNSKKTNSDSSLNSFKDKNVSTNADSIKIGDVIQSICGLSENGAVKISGIPEEELITLDDILNLWDGIRETPGRILIISSNHYNKLDTALTRPGRIDITHEFSNATRNTITEMYAHLFENKIDTEMLKNVEEYFYSPAEIINMYVTYKNEDSFMKRLMENKKV
jgi:hypothetical protein